MEGGVHVCKNIFQRVDVLDLIFEVCFNDLVWRWHDGGWGLLVAGSRSVEVDITRMVREMKSVVAIFSNNSRERNVLLASAIEERPVTGECAR